MSDVVFRVRNGEVVVYSRPKKQKISNSEAAVNARKKFALTVALAKEINSNKTLSEIWKNSKIKAINAYQKIIKYNSTLTNSESLTLKNSITPPDGFTLGGIKVTFEAKTLSIQLEKSKNSKQLLKSEKLFCLVYLWGDKKEKANTKSNTFFIMKLFDIELGNLDNSKDNVIDIDLSKAYTQKFNNGLIFVATTYKTNNKIFYSSTFACKIL